MTGCLIVGASLAGVRAAETLRHEGFEGRITIVGSEPHMPYDRPPLSKKFLAGEWEADRIALRSADSLASLEVDWVLGRRADALDTARRRVTLDDGRDIGFDGLIIATGGVARRLPLQEGIDGVHVLRTLDDAVALRSDVVAGSHVVVVGAGFIGLEAAATFVQRGATVTVLEGLDAPLMRALGTDMGRAIGDVHCARGITIRCGVRITSLRHDGRVTGVELADGEVVPADTVLVGIGVSPAVDWLGTSTLHLDDGIVCDEYLNVGTPSMFAAGDVVRWPNGLFVDVESTMRVEHWTNAAEQGAHAARNLLAHLRGGDVIPYSAVPFFWSDQFDMRIQFLGRAPAGATVDVVAGEPADGRWCAIYSVAGRLTGVLGVSMPKLVMPSRSLLATVTTRDDALAHFAAAAM
jgi:NADPH-dependent 2,4-dienoyl-CoA reductase/sulfur reductase-like enzyme